MSTASADINVACGRAMLRAQWARHRRTWVNPETVPSAAGRLLARSSFGGRRAGSLLVGQPAPQGLPLLSVSGAASTRNLPIETTVRARKPPVLALASVLVRQLQAKPGLLQRYMNGLGDMAYKVWQRSTAAMSEIDDILVGLGRLIDELRKPIRVRPQLAARSGLPAWVDGLAPVQSVSLRMTGRTDRMPFLTGARRPMRTGGTDGGTVGFLSAVFSMTSTASVTVLDPSSHPIGCSS